MKNNKMVMVGLMGLLFGVVSQMEAAKIEFINETPAIADVKVHYLDEKASERGIISVGKVNYAQKKQINVESERELELHVSLMYHLKDGVHGTILSTPTLKLKKNEISRWRVKSSLEHY